MELACFCACTAAGTVLRLCGSEVDAALDQAGGTATCPALSEPCPLYTGPLPDLPVPQGCAVSAVYDPVQRRFRLVTMCDRRESRQQQADGQQPFDEQQQGTQPQQTSFGQPATTGDAQQ
jgi:hypothetical protein